MRNKFSLECVCVAECVVNLQSFEVRKIIVNFMACLFYLLLCFFYRNHVFQPVNWCCTQRSLIKIINFYMEIFDMYI